MVKMIAIKAHTYGTKTLKADEEFDVEEGYVGTLVSLGRARLAEQKSTKVEPTTTKSKTEKAEPSETAEEKPDSTYQTRRLKADK